MKRGLAFYDLDFAGIEAYVEAQLKGGRSLAEIWEVAKGASAW